jgi:hypothetical protein
VTVTAPPAPTDPVPTARFIAPPAPPVAVPVFRAAEPEVPDDATPVESVMEPLTPVVPAFEVARIMSPDVDADPIPLYT